MTTKATIGPFIGERLAWLGLNKGKIFWPPSPGDGFPIPEKSFLRSGEFSHYFVEEGESTRGWVPTKENNICNPGVDTILDVEMVKTRNRP